MMLTSHGRKRWPLLVTWLFAASLIAGGQIQIAATADDTGIAAVETYGLRHVDRKAVLDAANLDPGDQPPRSVQWKAIAGRVEQRVVGVRRAAVVVITAPFETTKGGTVGRPIVYIGVQESDQSEPHFRAAPSGKVALPKPITKVYAEYERTFVDSVRHNDFSEDDSNGYALMGNAAARAVQRKFPALAEENYDRLVDVLHNSKHAEQRAMAATLIGYATNKKRAASDLVFATQDPSELVRNDAVRALSVLLMYARNHRDLGIEISTDWCLDFLESLTWTDRNKAMAFLNAATVDRDPALLAKLRQRSLPSLVEMAHWKSAGHAMMAFLLVGRVAGLSEEEIKTAWDAGKREKVIDQALASQATERPTDSK